MQSKKRLLLQSLFWTLVIIGTSGYWLACYYAFSTALTGRNSNLMGLAFLIGLPFSISTTISYFLSKTRARTFKLLGISLAVAILSVVGAIAIFKEGSICIVMFISVAIVPYLAGLLVGSALIAIKQNLSRNTLMSFIVLLPFAFGSIEQNIIPQDVVHEVKESTFIQASPEIIWRNIMHPTNIKPAEFKNVYAYEIGVPYPLEATVVQQKVGGIRKSKWQRGVSFDEEITALKPNRYIEWIYHFTDQSFPPGSLDDHVKVGGMYFDLKNTSYTLRPEGKGTYLDISVKYRVTTHLNWYAVHWAQFLIGDTSKALLQLYKNRSELNNAQI